MKTKVIASIGILLTAGIQVSQAVVVDLTTADSSGTANGGIFEWTAEQPTGTGVIKPFVRIQNNGTEEGYNTDNSPPGEGPMPDVKVGTHTHDILLSAVPVVTKGGVDYYQFLLDIFEVQGGGKEFLSLHELQIFTKDGALASANEYSDLVNGADLVWDLDEGEDSVIELNSDLNPGNGAGDMFAYIPVSAVGTDLTKNLYLYSAFGDTQPSDGSFEEWAVLTPEPRENVPDGGGTLVSLGVALLGLGSMRKLIGAKA